MHRDSVSIQGVLSVFRIYGNPSAPLSRPELALAIKEGRASITLCQRNLVVDIGLQTLSRFLGNNVGSPLIGGATFDNVGDIAVGSMQLGDAVGPPAPAPGDTVGVTSLAYTPNLVASYPGPYTVEFSGLLPLADGDGVSYTEEAILLRNGLLFAKTTFAVLKTSDFALQFTHAFTLGLPPGPTVALLTTEDGAIITTEDGTYITTG